ncbi:MAG: (2Fe-2S)-binding protein [Myxococcota bacterium]
MTRLLCRCMGMSSRCVADLARERGLTDLESIAESLGAGGCCGSCRPDLEEILADLRGAPLPESVRRANYLRGEAEALRRVDAVLFGGIAARLPPGAELELVSVAGLRVELHVSHGDSPELRALVAERLQKLVCAELEVLFR